MSNFRFVRKNGKVLGPLAPDRIDQLFSDGKLEPSDELSPDKEGPWQSIAKIRERIEQRKAEKAKQDEANASEAFAVPGPDVQPDPFADMPDFSDTLDTPAPAIPQSVVNPAHTYRSTAQQTKTSPAREANWTGEELDATDPLRWIFPWKWETDTQPYPMLLVYLRLMKLVLMLTYLLFLAAGVLFLLNTFVGILYSLGDQSVWVLFVMILVAPILALLWYLAAQLFYIAGTASIDLVRCILAIERNTR